LRLRLVFGETHPGHFGVRVGDAWDHTGVERGGCQLLVALQFTCNHFGHHMRLMGWPTMSPMAKM
jgi:hypothetical protein